MKSNLSILKSFSDNNEPQPIFALVLALVLIIHWQVVTKLMQPTEPDKLLKQPQVVEVKMVSLVKPKEKELPPPEPPKPKPIVKLKPKLILPPKKVLPPVKPPAPTPEKKPAKPPEKKPVKSLPIAPASNPFVHKQGDILKPTITRPENRFPVQPFPTQPGPKVTTPLARPQTSSKPTTSNIGQGRKTDTGTNPVSQHGGVSSPAAVIGRVQPSYPARAMSRHVEGWVRVEFTVTAGGAVANPTVTGAEPEGFFEEAALSAISRYRFKPKMVNGTPVAQRASQTIRFNLN